MNGQEIEQKSSLSAGLKYLSLTKPLKALRQKYLWVIWVLIIFVLAGIFIRYSFKNNIVLILMNVLNNYLPLTLSLCSVFLSIMLRPKGLSTFRGWIEISHTISYGLISFAIWAYVAGRSSGDYIQVNPVKVMNSQYALLLLIISFSWTAVTALVVAITDSMADNFWLKFGQGLMLVISIILVASPYFLFEKNQK